MPFHLEWFRLPQMKFYAHTASESDGRPDRDQSRWQPLSVHLRNVGEGAKQFVEPFGLQREAELAMLLHDYQTQNQ